MTIRLLLVLLMASSCSEARRNLVSDPKSDGGGPTDGGARMDSGARTDSGSRDAQIVFTPDSGTTLILDAATAYCGKRPCSCNDGQDNDGDGLNDGLDPECTGAFDDDEASFATGQPTKQMSCRDCYWDANSGSGDDSCRYPAECLVNPAFVGNGNCDTCAVSSVCETTCKARTPNGCDCFGCCAVARPSGEVVHIQLVESCTLTNADDSNACPRCTPHEGCKNDCSRCELCLGKTLADLPADCRSGTGPGYVCDDDLIVCSDTSPCPYGFYCHQGCCLVDLL